MKTLKIVLTTVSPWVCFDVTAQQRTVDGFVEGSALSLTLRNFYFNRDFRNDASNAAGRNAFKPVAERNGYAEEWAQGFMLNYLSGFTPGLIGFGVDAYSYLGVKLDTGGGRSGLRLMPLQDDGHPQDSFSKSGAAVKMKLSKTILKYGNQFPAVPVFAVNTVRLFPSSATGWTLSVDEISSLHADAGHFTGRGGVDSSNNNDPLTLDYGLPISIRSIDYLGGIYRLANGLKFSLYGANLKDTWHQYYGNASYIAKLSESDSVIFDANVYRTADTGKQMAGVIENTTWSLSVSYRHAAHTMTMAYQRVDSDEPMDWVGFGTMGGSVVLANAVQYATFTEPNERSMQVRYDFDAAALGIPGLTFMARYVRGDSVSNRHSENTFYTARYVYPAGADPRHWERDLEARYVVQSGAARDLSVRVRQAVHRSSSGYRYPDNNELRLIIDYPLSLF
jgi:imipenem/basic amino acid-specific outer membrane pore